MTASTSPTRPAPRPAPSPLRPAPRRTSPVVVVGAGAAGLVAATVLAHHDVDVLLLERRPTGSALPRATVLSLRTMELLRGWGLEDEVLAGRDDVAVALLETPSAAQAGHGTVHDVGYASVGQSTVLSPSAAACVAQDHLEAVLTAHLEGRPGVVVRRGVAAVGITEEDDGPRLRLREEASGAEEWVQASYVVAADGARSTIREGLGIAMQGPGDLMRGLSVEFRAPLWDVLGPHRYAVYTLTGAAAPAVLVPAGRGDRWVLNLVDEPGSPGPEGAAALVERVRAAAGVPDLPVTVERTGRYSAGAQLAARFSVGSIYLVGDAAHRITPRGGTGLNTAIADGHDLGWKLAWVLRGWAPPRLLDSYEAERRGPATHNVVRSTDPMGSRRPPLTEVQNDLGGRLPHAWVEDQDGHATSTLDLLTPGLTLLTAGPAGPVVPDDEARARPPVTTVGLPPGTARALGLVQAGAALLVRPDGVPVASWPTTPSAEQLSAVLDAWLGRPDQRVDGEAVATASRHAG